MLVIGRHGVGNTPPPLSDAGSVDSLSLRGSYAPLCPTRSLFDAGVRVM